MAQAPPETSRGGRSLLIGVKVQGLALRTFRNYAAADLEFGPGLNLVFGANAQGKSNLLEAVYLVLTGRSHRTLRDSELIQFGEDMSRVRVSVEGRRGLEDYALTVSLDDGRPQRWLRVNGVSLSRTALAGRAVSIVAAPEDLDIVAGPPSSRRRFLDVTLAQLSPAYLHVLQRYARVIAQRNRLLRVREIGRLDPWDEQMTDLGVRLTVRRREYVLRFALLAAAWYARFAGRSESLEIAYLPSWAGTGDEDVRHSAQEAIRGARRVETIRGVTLTGPHRDDVRLTVSGQDLRAFGSRGQQRAAALALRMAEYELAREEWGENPVLLLDDVVGELDEGRRAALFEALQDGQAILTTTSLGAGSIGQPTRLFEVVHGTAKEVPCLPLFETS